MIREDFEKSFADALQRSLPEAEIDSLTIEKLDGVRTGLGIRFSDKQAQVPVVYPESLLPMVDKGLSVEQIAKMVSSELKQYRSQANISLADLNNPAQLRLVTAPLGVSQELLEHVPHFTISGTDVTCVVRYEVHRDEDCEQSFLVKNDHLSLFQMTDQEIIQKALDNTRENVHFSILTLSEQLERMGVPAEMAQAVGEPQLYVIRTEDGRSGAVALALPEILDQAHEKIGADCFVIPSSTEELLVIDKAILEYAPIDYLRDMVASVNENEVEENLQLSNNLFFYDGDSLQMATNELVESLQNPELEELSSALEQVESQGRSR